MAEPITHDAPEGLRMRDLMGPNNEYGYDFRDDTLPPQPQRSTWPLRESGPAADEDDE